MTYCMLGIQAGFRPLELGSPLPDGCEQDGKCGPEQNLQVGQIVQEQDFRPGMQLSLEGLNRELQALQLEQQAQQQSDDASIPYGSMGDNSCSPNNSQYWLGQTYGDGENCGSGNPNSNQYGWPSQNYGCGNDGGLSESNYGCGWNELTVNGNSVDTGRFCITGSTTDGGSCEVKDKTTGETIKVAGDPHITTTDKNGNIVSCTSFQGAPATIKLPDGTEMTFTPTNENANGVAYIDKVTITKEGNPNGVIMTGFQGNLHTQGLAGEGRYLEQTTRDGTVLMAGNKNPDQLSLPDGTKITGNNVPNIDGYANDKGRTGGNIAQLRQEIVALAHEMSEIEWGMGFMANPLEII